MFQTEINHFFQSFASDELTVFMQFITVLGYQEFFLVFLLILLLAIDLKKGFLMFMVLLWTAVVTFIFKDYFDLPRPFHVDNTVELLDGKLPEGATFSFSKRGATSFWETLPKDVLQVIRQSEGIEHGFPSGHSSIAIAFWGALALLFRKRWIYFITIALMALIPLSRIYLGVHFLADVLGGIFLGGFILGLFFIIVLRPKKLSSFLSQNHYKLGLNSISAVLLLAPLLFIFFLPPKVLILPAFMFGLGLGFLLLSRKGLPYNEVKITQRIGRTFIGVLTMGTIGCLLKMGADHLGLDGLQWADFFIVSIAGLALIWIGTEISIRIGWFIRDSTESA